MSDLESMAEELIVEAARRGDVDSLGMLYRRYYATMVWLAYSVLLDRDLAQDAAQQTFVKACEGLTDLKCPDRFAPWLAAICRNEAHRLIRARKQLVGRRQANEIEVTHPVHDNDDHSAVRAAINGLDPMYREIVILHYYNGMDYRRIAATLGIGGHTVRGRLFRARRQIEETLRKNGFPEGS